MYPYYEYLQANGVIPLDYALFRPLPPNKEAVDANTLLHYNNVLDTVVDAAYFAMAAMNITNLPVIIAETGWPSKGDPTKEPDATADNVELTWTATLEALRDKLHFDGENYRKNTTRENYFIHLVISTNTCLFK